MYLNCLNEIDDSTIRLVKKSKWKKWGKIAGGVGVAAAAGALGYYGSKRQIGALKAITAKKDYIDLVKKIGKPKITKIGRLKQMAPWIAGGAGLGAAHVGMFGLPAFAPGVSAAATIGPAGLLYGFYQKRREQAKRKGIRESRWKSFKKAVTPLPALQTKMRRIKRIKRR